MNPMSRCEHGYHPRECHLCEINRLLGKVHNLTKLLEAELSKKPTPRYCQYCGQKLELKCTDGRCCG